MGDELTWLGWAKSLSSLFPPMFLFFFFFYFSEWTLGSIIGPACSSTSAHLSSETGRFPGRSFMSRSLPSTPHRTSEGSLLKDRPRGRARQFGCVFPVEQTASKEKHMMVTGINKKKRFNRRNPSDGLFNFKKFNSIQLYRWTDIRMW